MHIEYDRLEGLYGCPPKTRDELKEAVRIKAEADVKLLSNQELFEDFAVLAQGGDCAYGHSEGGYIVLRALDNELHYRLRECGFLPKEGN